MGTIIQKGIKYGEGKDGFSPVVNTKEIENGYRVDIRDAQGNHTFDILNGKNGLSEGKVYTSLNELVLTADATVQDVIDALEEGETAIISTNEFTNYKNGMFPNQCTNDQYGVFTVVKESGSKCFIEWRQKAGNAYAIGGLDSNNKFTNWNNLVRFKKDGFADDSIVCIGDTLSSDGVIQTLANLGFTTDVMTWDTGVYRVSHISDLTNLPSDLPSTAPGFRLEHHDCKKWGSNHSPASATWGQRHSMLYAEGGNVYHRYTESGNTAGTFTKDTGWQRIIDKTILVTNTSTLKLDVIKKNSSWYGAIKLTYLYDTSPVEMEICFRSATDAPTWTINSGQKYVKNVTYTQDSSNTAHYTIGIEFSGTTYGCYQAEVIGGFADIKSLTKDAFTGANVSPYGTPYGKNNGVTLVSAPEDIGLTFPCTSAQLAQAMRNKFNKTINVGAIGVFNNGGKTVCITDAPNDYGLLHIECFGHDRLLIRYDGIGGSSYAGSWIGKVTGSNGTFSGVTWERIDNHYSTGEVAVGTWIDGKTIYRKTFTKSPTSNQSNGNQVTIDVATISGLTNVIDIQATAKLQNYNNTSAPIYAKIPFSEMWRSNSGSTGAVYSIYVEGTTLKLHANSCTSDDIYYITVEYTK